ncbi:MAG: hypothetical protein RR324_10165 [Cellulosilyticaceae bacterium]
MNYEELLNKYNTLLKAYVALEYENKALKEGFGVPIVNEKVEMAKKVIPLYVLMNGNPDYAIKS